MNDLTPKWIWVKRIKRKKYVIEEFQEMGLFIWVDVEKLKPGFPNISHALILKGEMWICVP